MKKETEPKKKSKRLYIIIAVIVVLAIGSFAAGGSDSDDVGTETTGSTETETSGSTETETAAIDAADVLPEYVNVSNSEYARDGEKCIAYRVSVSADLSDDELTAVFNDVCADDGYYLHTVYFYSSSDLADGGDVYDVAIIEETAAGSDPTLTRK